MTDTRVPDIALINLGFLLALKDAVMRNPVLACQEFRLHPADAAVVRDLTFDRLESLALGLDGPIVTLRYTGRDLLDLVTTHPALRSVFAGVRALVEERPGRPGQSRPGNRALHPAS